MDSKSASGPFASGTAPPSAEGLSTLKLSTNPDDPLHRAFMAMHEGVLVQDRQGRVLASNPAASRILGVNIEERIGKPLNEPGWDPVREDGTPLPADAHPGYLAIHTGKPQRDFVVGIHNAEGMLTWLQIQTDPVFVPGDIRPQAVVSTFADISQTRLAHEELKLAKQEAEESSRIKDKFVSLLAHDLRAPIAAAMTMLEMVAKDEAGKLAPENTEALNLIEERLKQQLELIDGVLSITRLRLGKLRVHRRKVPAGTALSAALMLKRQAEQKGIHLVNEIDFQKQLHVDPTLFGQVLQNLVSNAIKFTPAGGTIRIYVPSDRPNAIAVRDSGVGVESSRLPDLFRADVKTSTVGTAGERGTGMGLPLSHDIMAAHGGSLEVESKPGEGTVFYANLPPYRPVVLVVDDEIDLRALVKRYLLRQGCEVLEAGNGEDALNLLKTAYANLIVTDVQMPKLDGFGLLDAVRRNPEIADIPVIVVTVGTDVETRDKAFALGANDFVTKPITPHDFLPRVRRFLT